MSDPVAARTSPAPSPATSAAADVPTLARLGAGMIWPDAAAAAAVRELAPPDAGRLADLAEWLAATQGACPPHAPRRARLLTLRGADAPVTDLAEANGAGVREIDVPPDRDAALAAGAAAADDEADSGSDLLVVAAGAEFPAAGVVVSVVTEAEPIALLPRGPLAVDSGAWITAATQLRAARRPASALRGVPDELLAAVDSPALAFLAGLISRAAARRTPMLLDGSTVLAAALLCREAQSRAARWWRVADVSTDPVHTRATAELDQRPLLDLGTSRGDGIAGLLCLPLLRAAAALTTAPNGSGRQ